MEAKLSKTYTVPASTCDWSGSLGYADAFSVFMDIAGEHAEILGVGIDDFMRRGIFWLTVRTRVRFHRRPHLLENVTVSTWPETPGGIRCNRDYLIEKDGEILVEGKTEWAVTEISTGRLVKPADVFPEGLEYPEPIMPGQFMRINADFSGAETVSRHTVRATDIDVGGHMNNAAYVYSLIDCFPVPEQRENAIKEIEIAFRSSAHEGDELVWQRLRTEDGWILRAMNGETVAALAKITI